MKNLANNSGEDINPQAKGNTGRETTTSNISIIQLIKYSHNFAYPEDDEAQASSQQHECVNDEEEQPQQQEAQQQSQKQQEEEFDQCQL